jgi:hypothetical protein
LQNPIFEAEVAVVVEALVNYLGCDELSPRHLHVFEVKSWIFAALYAALEAPELDLEAAEAAG